MSNGSASSPRDVVLVTDQQQFEEGEILT